MLAIVYKVWFIFYFLKFQKVAYAYALALPQTLYHCVDIIKCKIAKSKYF